MIDLKPVTVDTATDVSIEEVGPDDVCILDHPPYSVFVFGGAGEVCDVRLHADGDDTFAPLDIPLSIKFEVASFVSWTFTGPPAVGCVTPSQELPDLVIKAIGKTESLQDVTIQDATNVTAEEKERTDEQVVVGLTINDDAPTGSNASVAFGWTTPGQAIIVADADTTLTWKVEESCPPPSDS